MKNNNRFFKSLFNIVTIIFLCATKTIAQQSIATFENTANDVFSVYSWEGSSGTFGVADNPSKSGIDSTNKCLLNYRTKNGSSAWTVAGEITNNPLNPIAVTAATRYLHIMVYSNQSVDGYIRLRYSATDDKWLTPAKELRFSFTSGKWTDLVLDLQSAGVTSLYGLYFMSQDWNNVYPQDSYFYYDEILLNSDPSPRGSGVLTSACTVGDFENPGINPPFTMEGTSGGSTISRVENPENRTNNTTSYVLKIKEQGETTWWSRAKILFNNYVKISSATRYLHMMIKCPYNLSVLTYEPSEHWFFVSPPLRNQWSDVVVDLMSSGYNLSNTVLQSVGICANSSTYIPDMEWYVDEIAFSANPNPRSIVPSIIDSISCSMNTLDDDWTFVNTNPANDIVITNNAKLTSDFILNIDVRNESKEPFTSLNDTLSLAPGQTTTIHHELNNPQPGFYRYYINVSDGNIIRNKIIRQIAYSPDLIQYKNDSQSDFDDFWNAAKAELATVAPAYNVTFNSYYGTHKIYNVEMKSIKGKTIKGYLSLPDKAGKFPAIIISNGFGVTATIPDRTDDYVVFTYNVRGQGISTDYSPTDNIFVNGLTDKTTYYYRECYMDAIRAVDFVCSRAEVDTTEIFAEGESQGGALTFVIGALDSRIRAISPRLPFMSDFPLYYKIKENVNEIPEWPMDILNQYMVKYGLTDNQTFTNLSYFDIKNLAKKVTCPILMASSLQDPTCPPAINFAAYNLASSVSKQYVIFKANGHWSDASFLTFKDAWYKSLIENTDAGSLKYLNNENDVDIITLENEIQVKSKADYPVKICVYKPDGAVVFTGYFTHSYNFPIASGVYLVTISNKHSFIKRKVFVG